MKNNKIQKIILAVVLCSAMSFVKKNKAVSDYIFAAGEFLGAFGALVVADELGREETKLRESSEVEESDSVKWKIRGMQLAKCGLRAGAIMLTFFSAKHLGAAGAPALDQRALEGMITTKVSEQLLSKEENGLLHNIEGIVTGALKTTKLDGESTLPDMLNAAKK